MDVAIRIVEQRKESGLPLPGACNGCWLSDECSCSLHLQC